MTELAAQRCIPCSGEIPRLSPEVQQRMLAMLGSDWRIVNRHHLQRDFSFEDFRTAWAFTNSIAEVAEAEGHHPDILLSWGRVRVTIWTHAVKGLTESDFVLAAKIGKLSQGE